MSLRRPALFVSFGCDCGCDGCLRIGVTLGAAVVALAARRLQINMMIVMIHP